MAKLWSTGLVDFVAARGSLRNAAANARFMLFGNTGQPVTPDEAATGATLLATLTSGGASFVGEVLGEWKVTLSGSAGAINGMGLGSLVRAGTAQAGAVLSMTLDVGASGSDDTYNGMFALITSGTGFGQVRRISDYTGSSLVATISRAWDTVPDATSGFNIAGGIDLFGITSVPFTTDLSGTAAAAATVINSTLTYPDFTAESAGADITVIAPVGSGAELNSLRLWTLSNGGITSTVANAAKQETVGVACSGGINWDSVPDNGEIAKEAATASASFATNGTMQWFRVVFDKDDTGLEASTTYRRLDGLIAVSGGDMTVGSTLAVAEAPVLIKEFPLSVLKS